MPTRNFALVSVASGLLFFGLVPAAQAVDGVVLIDQNRALSGNVTSCDTPGFPVQICQPGSYRLSGNLTAPPGVTAIIVDSNNVSIDLNGFAITGQDLGTAGNQPFGIIDTRSCTQENFPEVTVCHAGISVQNGSVSGFFSGVDFLFASASVDRIHSHNNTNIGIRVSKPGVIRNSVADHNGAGFALPDCPILLADSAAANNTFNIRMVQPLPNSCVVSHTAAP